MGIHDEQSQQKLATIVVCFGLLSLYTYFFFWPGPFVTAPTDLLAVSYYVCYPMYPAHAANTFPVVRDQQKLGHISRGNNSIEMRTERCGCCQHMSVQIPQKDNFCKFSNKVLFCDQFLKSDKVKSTAYLSAVYVFHCSLTKEEVYEIALRHGTHKVRR